MVIQPKNFHSIVGILKVVWQCLRICPPIPPEFHLEAVFELREWSITPKLFSSLVWLQKPSKNVYLRKYDVESHLIKITFKD